jgi:inward rectifier potassium channel
METSEHRFSQIQKIGTQKKWLQDLYHSLLVFSWTKFFFSYLVFFALFNIIFAYLYWLFPGAISGTDNSFWQSFVFSVQTFSTVGYGTFSPHSDWAHGIVIIESVLSVFVTAVLTGLIFSKFSRPSARIIFSDKILINDFDGKRTLMFRMGNLRANLIAQAQVNLVALMSFKTVEGQSIRRQVDLNVTRSTSLFFALTWSVMHVIDETSPLYQLTLEDFKKQAIDIGVSLIGYDSTFSQSIHANCIYKPEDIIFDRYFADVFQDQDGRVVSIDYNKFHLLK